MRPQHADLGRGLVLGAVESGVHPLGQVRVQLVGEGPQPGRPGVGQVAEPRAVGLGGLRPAQRRQARQVEVIGDDDRRARAPFLTERTGGIGQDDRAAARRRRGPDVVDDGRDGVALVAVDPPEVGQDRPAVGVQRPDRATVTGHRRAGEARQLTGGHLTDGGPDPVGRRAPARPQHDGDVVLGDSDGRGQRGGGFDGQGVRVGRIGHDDHRRATMAGHGTVAHPRRGRRLRPHPPGHRRTGSPLPGPPPASPAPTA